MFVTSFRTIFPVHFECRWQGVCGIDVYYDAMCLDTEVQLHPLSRTFASSFARFAFAKMLITFYSKVIKNQVAL